MSSRAPFILSLKQTTELLKLCADNRWLMIGKMVHAHLITTDQVTNPDDFGRTNSLLGLYSKCGELVVSRQLFDSMPERNVVSWSSLMLGYSRSKCYFEVLRLLKDMVCWSDTKPNEYIFSIVFGSCTDSGKVEEGRQCHGYVLKTGLVFHQYVRNALVYMYTKRSGLESAMLLMDSVGYDVYSYNSVLSGLIEHGSYREGVGVLKKMLTEGLSWDSVTCVSIFGLCAGLQNLKLGLEVHAKMLRDGVKCDAFVCGALINMYGRCGQTLYARRVFDRLCLRNVVLWTSIMAAYFQNGFFEETLNLFTVMELEDTQPNELTFAVLLNSTAGLSLLRYGDLLHARAEKSGYKDYVTVGNALIHMYSKSGCVEAANKVFSHMIDRDIITWNEMICGYSHHGLGNEALNVFHAMVAAGDCPNYITFVGILSACSHLGLIHEGFYYINQLMKQSGVEPGLEHYTCIVGLLSRAGLLDEAENFMKSTQVEWDVIAWRTLLNACHVHKNYGLGKRVAEIITKMDPTDAGTYTIVSNMYANAKRWDGVARIRKMMRIQHIKKEPGVSWIDIRSITHVFVCDDNKHPDSSEIYEKVKEILAKIKPLGYVPDVGSVLHDVEDEQKEDYLSYHSEKLAVAYGLMKTPKEIPLRVFKNLRMCDDCHSAMKLISKVATRVIIIRDANRFHHFRDGHCSCGDYW